MLQNQWVVCVNGLNLPKLKIHLREVNFLPRMGVKFILACLVFFSSAATLNAQNDTLTLEQIEVFGLKTARVSSSGSPVQQMNIRQLNAIPSLGIAGAIRNLPGVVIKDFGGIGGLKTVMVRSLGSNHTGVFVDGMLTGDVATGQMDLSKIPSQQVGSIKLMTGLPDFNLQPARVYASASILNVESSQPEFEEDNHIVNLSFRAGSFTTFNPSVSVDSKISHRLTTAVRLNYFTSKGNYPFTVHNGTLKTEHRRVNSDIQSVNASFKAQQLLNDSSTLTIQGNYFDSQRGLPGAVILYNTRSAQRLLNRDLNAGIRYETRETNSTRFLTNVSFSNALLEYTDPDFHNQSGGLHNTYTQQEYYLSQAVMLPVIQNINFSLAADLIGNRLQTNAYSVSDPARFTTLLTGNLQYINSHTEILTGLLLTSAFDYFDNQKNKTFLRLSPALSVLQSFQAIPSIRLRIMYKDIFRMPTFHDMYYTIIGNNKLKPEKASLFNAGVLFDKELNKYNSLSLRVDGFVNMVEDKIVTVPTQNLFVWSTRNIGKADIKGMELFASLFTHFNSKWSTELSVNYTRQIAKDVTDKASSFYGHQLVYTPYETAGGLLSIHYWNISLGVNTLFNGYRYTSQQNSGSNLLSSWNTTDFTLAYQTKIYQKEIGIKTEIANAFNHHFEVVKGFPMTGRSFYIQIFINF